MEPVLVAPRMDMEILFADLSMLFPPLPDWGLNPGLTIKSGDHASCDHWVSPAGLIVDGSQLYNARSPIISDLGVHIECIGSPCVPSRTCCSSA